METGQFCFRAVNPFGLEFNNSAETFNPAGVLGFDAISYRGENAYCSVLSFQVPTSSCCGAESTRFSSYVFTTKATINQSKLLLLWS